MENEIERIRQDIRLYFDGHNGLDGDTYQLAEFGIYYYPSERFMQSDPARTAVVCTDGRKITIDA